MTVVYVFLFGVLSFIKYADYMLFKSPLPGLSQFLTNERPLKMMKNAFCFTLKSLFAPKIFKSLY